MKYMINAVQIYFFKDITILALLMNILKLLTQKGLPRARILELENQLRKSNDITKLNIKELNSYKEGNLYISRQLSMTMYWR